MKLLIDMILSPRWPGVLQAGGFEVLHWSDVGPLDAPDAEIMSFATNGGFVVILAVTKGAQPSVVQLRPNDLSPEPSAAAVVAALTAASGECERGALLTIDADRARRKLLPLREA